MKPQWMFSTSGSSFRCEFAKRKLSIEPDVSDGSDVRPCWRRAQNGGKVNFAGQSEQCERTNVAELYSYAAAHTTTTKCCVTVVTVPFIMDWHGIKHSTYLLTYHRLLSTLHN